MHQCWIRINILLHLLHKLKKRTALMAASMASVAPEEGKSCQQPPKSGTLLFHQQSISNLRWTSQLLLKDPDNLLLHPNIKEKQNKNTRVLGCSNNKTKKIYYSTLNEDVWIRWQAWLITLLINQNWLVVLTVGSFFITNNHLLD